MTPHLSQWYLCFIYFLKRALPSLLILSYLLSMQTSNNQKQATVFFCSNAGDAMGPQINPRIRGLGEKMSSLK